MLVISRRAGERIVIGNDIHVVVTEIKRRSVRIGVMGSPETVILRGEVYESVKAANRAALKTTFEAEEALEALLTGAEASLPEPIDVPRTKPQHRHRFHKNCRTSYPPNRSMTQKTGAEQ